MDKSIISYTSAEGYIRLHLPHQLAQACNITPGTTFLATVKDGKVILQQAPHHYTKPPARTTRSCVLCGQKMEVWRAMKKPHLLCGTCHRTHSVLVARKCPRCQGSLVRSWETDEAECISCGFRRRVVTRVQNGYVLLLC